MRLRNRIHSWCRWARHARAEHVAGQRAQRGEQGGRPMPFVVVRHGAGPALLYRQPRLRPVEGLNLALLVDREDQGVGRRVEIEAHDVFELLREVRVAADLEGTNQVGLQPVALPDAPDARGADPQLGRQRPRTPVRRRGRPLPRRLADDLGLDRASLHRRWSPTARCVLLDPGRPLLSKPPPPESHGFLPDAQVRGDGRVQPAVGGAQHDPGAPYEARWGAAAPRPLPEHRSFGIGQHDGRGNSWHIWH